MHIHLAYSPCPNDTYIFHQLINARHEKFTVKEELYDVDQLNEFALQGKFEATKLSFAAFFHVAENYALLNSGAALGRGCGPILVKKKGTTPSLNNPRVVTPGRLTTANLLLNLYTGGVYQPIHARYDKIIDLVSSGETDFGVIIHEERFTFEERGLEIVKDLGQFWEEESGLPIPLGGIAIKRSVPRDIALEFDNHVKKSIESAKDGKANPYGYILEHSQNKSEDIIQKHIDLYVNDFTLDLGEEGRDAIMELHSRSGKTGNFPGIKHSLFLL